MSKAISRLLFSGIIIFSTLGMSAQRKVTGTVSDEDGAGLPGVSVSKRLLLSVSER